jgi:hypothetical protein
MDVTCKVTPGQMARSYSLGTTKHKVKENTSDWEAASMYLCSHKRALLANVHCTMYETHVSSSLSVILKTAEHFDI